MMWISFRCKSGGEVDQFWMQFNTIQCVPDLVTLLNEKNIAIYQVVRGEKTKALWR